MLVGCGFKLDWCFWFIFGERCWVWLGCCLRFGWYVCCVGDLLCVRWVCIFGC